MASRYFSAHKEKKIRAPKGPKPGLEGQTPSSAPLSETTAAWPPCPGPCGMMPFNRGANWPVVKTAAKKAGLC